MSSTYRVLCLSHDPATVHGEYLDAEDAFADIADGLPAHPRCDLMVGRYSGALVELGCPRTKDQRHGTSTCNTHGGPVWADGDWLRLLAAAHQSPDPEWTRRAVGRGFDCWSWERLFRLRLELDLQVREVAW